MLWLFPLMSCFKVAPKKGNFKQLSENRLSERKPSTSKVMDASCANVCLTLTWHLKATISFSVPFFNFLKWNCHLQSSICEVFWCYWIEKYKAYKWCPRNKMQNKHKRIFNFNSVLFTTNKLVIDVMKWFDEMRLSKRSKWRKWKFEMRRNSLIQ